MRTVTCSVIERVATTISGNSTTASSSTLLVIVITVAALIGSYSAAADTAADTAEIDEVTIERPLVAVDESAMARPSMEHSPGGHRVTRKKIVFGISRYQIGHKSNLIGWRMSERWYFGRHRADRSNVGFVWQKQANESVSIGHKGIRWVRMF